MSEICEGCKHAIGQKIPHGLPVNAAAWGCNSGTGYHCSTGDICRYFKQRLEEEGLLRPYTESVSYKKHGHKWHKQEEK